MNAAVPPLAGASIVITRPVGAGAALARRARALGARALLLPGLSLRAVADAALVRRALHAAWADDLAVFTSPAAVRFSARLGAIRPSARCRVCAIGTATARALQRQGISDVLVPEGEWNSEGLLAHPALARVDRRQVSLIGAAGGRDLLLRELRARGAEVRSVHVYQRLPAHLDRRHVDAVLALTDPSYVLLSSTATLTRLRAALPVHAWARLLRGQAVVSSARLAQAARAAGFAGVGVARSATDADLLAAAQRACARRPMITSSPQ